MEPSTEVSNTCTLSFIPRVLAKLRTRKTPPSVPSPTPVDTPSAVDTTIANTTGPFIPLMTIRGYDILKLIGSGAFGDVYLAKNVFTSKHVAVKVIPKRENTKDIIMHEQRALLCASGSPFVLEIEASFHDENNFYIVTEYVAGGTLEQEIWRKEDAEEKLDLQVAKRYAAEIMMGVHHLHMNGILHRDVKPDNILIRPNGHIVLADLGFAEVFDKESRRISNKTEESTHDETIAFKYQRSPWTDCTAQKILGTPEFIAPEVWDGKAYGFSADWWSVGVTLFWLITGKLPFEGETPEELADDIRTGNLPYDPAWGADQDMLLFIAHLLVKSPEDRLKPELIFDHTVFQDIDWNKVLNQDYEMPRITSPPPSYDDDAIETSKSQLLDRIAVGNEYSAARDPTPAFNFVSPVLAEVIAATAPTAADDATDNIFTNVELGDISPVSEVSKNITKRPSVFNEALNSLRSLVSKLFSSKSKRNTTQSHSVSASTGRDATRTSGSDTLGATSGLNGEDLQISYKSTVNDSGVISEVSSSLSPTLRVPPLSDTSSTRSSSVNSSGLITPCINEYSEIFGSNQSNNQPSCTKTDYIPASSTSTPTQIPNINKDRILWPTFSISSCNSSIISHSATDPTFEYEDLYRTSSPNTYTTSQLADDDEDLPFETIEI